MKKAGKAKTALFKTLDFLFPSLMNIIWGACFLAECRKNGYAVFDAKSEQEALDYLVDKTTDGKD
ncbi:MAG: hypothetical protein K6U80_02995 [Firmicutes bacterium]|nr:hypothetical protein [Bacillota bacterium]